MRSPELPNGEAGNRDRKVEYEDCEESLHSRIVHQRAWDVIKVDQSCGSCCEYQKHQDVLTFYFWSGDHHKCECKYDDSKGQDVYFFRHFTSFIGQF